MISNARCVRWAAIWLFLLGASSHVRADSIVPTSQVTSRVVVREQPSTTSRDIGSLRPGEHGEYLGSVPRWNHIRLTDGTEGFVSKRWTIVAADGAAREFTVDVADVGTGLGIVVRGEDFTLVYDGGSNDDMARGDKNRFVAFLRAIMPTRTVIDHLILSHPHQDHVELLPDVLASYEVRQVWDSGALNPICGYRSFLTVIRDEPGVQYHTAALGSGARRVEFAAKRCYGVDLPIETIEIPLASRIDEFPIALGQAASMRFLHADGSEHASFNENSLVVRLDLGASRVLLMGDAEAGGRRPPSEVPRANSIEGMLLACCSADVRADVLVVGHHGSRTSSRAAFLSAVGAQTFIISSGPKKYSSVILPDQDVIDELTSRGTVFRTDLNDATCGQNSVKIGPDADGEPGGCDNVRVTISGSGQVSVEYRRGGD